MTANSNQSVPNHTTFLIIPGLGGSGQTHWQSLWHKEAEHSVRLVQDNWDEPDRDNWIAKLNDTLIHLDGFILLIAHSLGVALVAHWASHYQNNNVKGAFLVAPADVDSPQYTPDAVRSFAPMPVAKLPFPSIVVASEDDPYVSIERAASFASQWGSDFTGIGAKGHINAGSNLGDWQQGKTLLRQWQEKIIR